MTALSDALAATQARAVAALAKDWLTKVQASQAIEQLKAGTYNPDEWTVPF